MLDERRATKADLLTLDDIRQMALEPQGIPQWRRNLSAGIVRGLLRAARTLARHWLALLISVPGNEFSPYKHIDYFAGAIQAIAFRKQHHRVGLNRGTQISRPVPFRDRRYLVHVPVV